MGVPVKRRRAMLASNPLRNSRSVLVATMSRTWNLRCVLAVNLGRTRPGSGTSARHLLVIDILQKRADFAARFGQIPVFAAVNLLIFQRFHE
jgi:hypothetical protein